MIFLSTIIGGIFGRAWLWMIVIGILHLHLWPALPPVGYWWALLLAAVFGPEITSKEFQ